MQRRSAPAALGFPDGGEPRRRGDPVEQIAGQRVGRLRQHRQRRPRHRRRRGAAGEPVGADHLALAVAGMRPVDRELPRPERTEAFDQMLRHRRIVRIAAAIPAPRGEPPKRLVDARDPGFLDAAGVAHQAVREQLGEALVEGVRQRFDESRLADVDIDHGEIAVELQARRGQRAAVPRQHFGFDRRSASASPSRSAACSRSSSGWKPFASMARRKAVRACIRSAPDAAGTLPARSSCRSPDRASSRRRCRRRRRRGWSRAASVRAGRSARSPAR